MSKLRRILIYGPQRQAIDLDLMAQIVIMLGRQLALEASSNDGLPSGDQAGDSLPMAEPST